MRLAGVRARRAILCPTHYAGRDAHRSSQNCIAQQFAGACALKMAGKGKGASTLLEDILDRNKHKKDPFSDVYVDFCLSEYISGPVREQAIALPSRHAHGA